MVQDAKQDFVKGLCVLAGRARDLLRYAYGLN